MSITNQRVHEPKDRIVHDFDVTSVVRLTNTANGGPRWSISDGSRAYITYPDSTLASAMTGDERGTYRLTLVDHHVVEMDAR